jgi:hypothetical protein
MQKYIVNIMWFVRALVSFQIAAFFMLPPVAFSALIGHIAGMVSIIIWGPMCAFFYGYVQSRGLAKFQETLLGKIYITDAKDSFHLGLLKFNVVVLVILFLSLAFRGMDWLEDPMFY